MSEKPVQDRKGQLRLPKRTVSASEELSVETRVAAQAIINEDSIGVHSPAPESPQTSRFIEWLLQYRVWLTVGIVVLLAAIILVSVFSEVNERSHQSELKTTLLELTDEFIQSGGPEMVSWIETNDVRAIDARFREQKTQMLQTLEDRGFSIKPENIKIRRDGKSRLVLGAIVQLNQQEEILVWGTRDLDRGSSQAQSKEPAQVFMEQWDSLTFIGLMALLFIAFIWLAPALLIKKKQA